MKILQNITIALFCAALLLYGGSELYNRICVDTTPPVLTCESDTVTIHLGDSTDVLLSGVTAHDKQDGDLTDEILIQGMTQLLGDNTARITYVVFDSANNMSTRTRTVVYADYEKPHFTLRRAPVYPINGPIALLDRLYATDVVDGDISSSIRIVSQNVVPSEEGVYSVTAQVTNSLGDSDTVSLKLVVSSSANELELELSEYIVYLNNGASFDPDSYIVSPAAYAVDVEHDVNTSVAGTYYVCYTYGSDTVYQTVIVK